MPKPLPLHMKSHGACEALTDTVATHALDPAGAMRARSYADRSTVWCTTDLPDRVFRLKSGRVHIVSLDDDGGEHLYRIVMPGELFGELCFCSYRREPHGTEARCLGPSEVWAISYEEFRRRIRNDVSLVDAVLSTFCGRVEAAEERVEILALNDARRRLARLLLHLLAARSHSAELPAECQLTMSHGDLARMAALSRPHVSVLMGEFRRRGLVAYGRTGPLRIRVEKLRRAFV